MTTGWRMIGAPRTPSTKGNDGSLSHSAPYVRPAQRGDVDGFAEALTDDFVEHASCPGRSGKEGTKAFFRGFIAAFPDLRITVADVLSSGDKVVARAMATGTNPGLVCGHAATGKAIRGPVDRHYFRFDDEGLACEHWGVFDAMKLMQQLGVVPTAHRPTPTAPTRILAPYRCAPRSGITAGPRTNVVVPPG